MPPVQFAVNAYKARALPLSAQNLVNFYAERAPQDAKSQVVLYETPGLKSFAIAGDGPIRGMHVMDGVLYAVSGCILYSIDALGKAAALGNICVGSELATPEGESGPASFSFMLTGGSEDAGTNQITSITVDGNEILAAAVDWTTSTELTSFFICENIKEGFPDHIFVPAASVDVTGQTSTAFAFRLSSDGTMLFVADGTAAIIYQYTVSSAYDLTSAVYSGISKDISSGTLPTIGHFAFSPDGTKMYQGSNNNLDLVQWNMSTAWDITTLVEAGKTASPVADAGAVTGMDISDGGTKLFYHTSSQEMYQYTFTTAFDLGTASYDSISWDFAPLAGTWGKPAFRDDGFSMYMLRVSGSERAVGRFTLPVAYDISTVILDSVEVDVSPAVGTSGMADLDFSPDGRYLYVLQSSGTDQVHQFLAPEDWECEVTINNVVVITSTEDGAQNNGLPVVITTAGDVTVDTPVTETAGGFDTPGAVASGGGNAASDFGCISMANNAADPPQLAIVDGASGWIYTTTGGLVQIVDTDFFAADTVDFQDQYFVFNRAGTGQFFLSNLNDGTAFTATDIATAEGDPDDLVAVVSNHRELWLFGTDTIEVWFNSGDADFPFDRISGSFIERGCAAAFSIVNIDNTLYWLGEDRIVYRASGFVPERISQHAMEQAIEGYDVVSDVCAFAYTMSGHKFYVMNFITERVTWVYDASTGLWHQRESRDATNIALGRWRGNAYANVYGKHLVGDFETGQVGELDETTFTEYGNTLQGLAVGPPIDNDRKRVFIQKFELDVESGVGLTTGQGSDPQIELAWSDDGGRTFSERKPWRSMGKIGEYRRRLRWHRQGSSRNRVYRIIVSDPVKRSIVAANIDIQPGMN